MSYTFYKFLHASGVFLVLMSYGALALHSLRGGDNAAPGRKMAVIMHGVGMLIALVAGFGLLAKLAIHWPWPGWIYGKVAVWLLLGGGVVLFKRKPDAAQPFLFVIYAIALAGAFLAQYKPF